MKRAFLLSYSLFLISFLSLPKDLFSQNVGIGTTTPKGKLHIKGSADTSQLVIDAFSTQSNTHPFIKLRDNSGVDLLWIHSDDSSNTFIGRKAGAMNNVNASVFKGVHNTFTGSNACFANTTGSYNTANGTNALYTNTTGNFNTASGSNALYVNSTGSYNTATGSTALSSNSTGFENTATGYAALVYNSTGSYNTANGMEALFSNTTGNQNTAIGHSALHSSTIGYNNTATGYQALYTNTTGYNNTATGYQALLYNTTGYQNIAMGVYALNANSTGYNNTAIGPASLYYNSSGSFNTAIGFQSLMFNSTGNLNIAMGYQPLSVNTTGTFNTAIGYQSLNSNTTGNSNLAIGYQTLYSNLTGGANIGIGDYANTSSGALNFAIALGDDATVNASNKIRIGYSGITIIEGQVGFSWPSDGRFKENIQDDVKGLDFIMKLQPVSYNFNRLKYAQHIKEHITSETEKTLIAESQNRTIGFVAQDVEKIIKQTGFTSFDAVHAPANETDNYSMGYAEFVVPLVKAVQEQQQLIEKQQAQINELLKRVAIVEKKDKP